MALKRRVHTDDDLRRVAEERNLPADLVERDFVLVTLAGELAEQYGDALCFKGGFVLRHVFGFHRTSRDVDATRNKPAKHKFDAAEIAEAMQKAARRGDFNITVPAPSTDSASSLDFDGITYDGKLSSGTVDVEISYREAVQLPPLIVPIGDPYYDPFEIPRMATAEIVAEKLRTLAQRRKPTDLADIGELLHKHSAEIDDSTVQKIVPLKFAQGIVKDGDHRGRILENIEAMRATYATDVAAVTTEVFDYERAVKLLKAKLQIYLGDL